MAGEHPPHDGNDDVDAENDAKADPDAGVPVRIAAGVWFYRHWTHGRLVEETNNADIQADQVIVSSRIGGAAEEVFVTDNGQVEVGQRLVRIAAAADAAFADAQVPHAAAGSTTTSPR